MDRNELLAATRATFMQKFTDLLDELILHGVDHLFSKADWAPTLPDQNRLLDARAVLLNQNIALKRQMVSAMGHLLNRSFQTAYSTFRPSFGCASNFSTLSLIEMSAFEDELHIDDLAKQFRMASEDQLRDLNIRIALLFEQEEIRERENPFRPYLFARCIITALEEIQISPELIAPLSQQLAEDLTNNTSAIYEALNALLAKHGIAAQLQLKIKKTQDTPPAHGGKSEDLEAGSTIFPTDSPIPQSYGQDDGWITPPKHRADTLIDWVQGINSADNSPQTPMRAGPQSANPLEKPATESPAHRGWLTGAKAAGEVLRNFFTGSRKSEEQPAAADDESFAADESLTAPPVSPLTESVYSLQQRHSLQTTPMLYSDGRIRNLILEHRDELSVLSRNENEQMIIDIVAMLFEFILRDGQVPAEVRAQLGRLQFLVLKVALLEPTLFSQKNHPARLLVNRIGSIVLGLQQVDPGGERVTAEICRIVEVLLADTTGDASIFANMLDEFDAFVARELRAADQKTDRAVQALEHAESRTIQFAHITGMISDALSNLKVDPFLHDFLVNTWARVIERAGRNDLPRAMRLRVLVPDLVWSIIPKPHEDDRKQLLGLIPELLNAIREGVALIGWTAAQQNELHSWLIDAHRHALRAGLGTLNAQVPPRSFIYSFFQNFVDATENKTQENSHREVILDGVLLDEAILEMETQLNLLDHIFDLDMNELMAAPESYEPLPEEATDANDEVFERLRSGVAIEILLGKEPTHAHLVWVSQTSSNIVLNIEGQATPTIIKIRAFRRLLESDRVRFLESAPLFERAVHNLLVSADNLDQHHTAK